MEYLYVLFAVAVIFIYFFRRDLKEKFIPNKVKYYTIDDQFNSDRKERQDEIDKILSKIGENGLQDLSATDKKRLDELSKKL